MKNFINLDLFPRLHSFPYFNSPSIIDDQEDVVLQSSVIHKGSAKPWIIYERSNSTSLKQSRTSQEYQPTGSTNVQSPECVTAQNRPPLCGRSWGPWLFRSASWHGPPSSQGFQSCWRGHPRWKRPSPFRSRSQKRPLASYPGSRSRSAVRTFRIRCSLSNRTFSRVFHFECRMFECCSF